MNPIQVGVCGWGDHDLYPPGTPSKDKLALYAGHFPVVEVDSTYHAIPPVERCLRWVEDTPETFRFVVKAYREMTGHGRPKGAPERPWREVADAFAAVLRPFRDSGKLSMVLFQFPPWFDCTREHVRHLRRCREVFADLPLAVEFRNRTWYAPRLREKTLRFLREEELIHTVCDEPQAGEGSIPIVPVVTHPDAALIRFHGRNREGWNNTGRSNWRGVRYAYRYSREELAEWIPRIEAMKREAKQVTVLFNNNSRGDAAPNAKELIDLMGLRFEGLAPRQLGIW